MKPILDRLNQINREFYATFAASFSETRSESAQELQVILPYIADGARVLDIGCGNGRAAALLGRQRRGVTYVGVDASEEMIGSARRKAQGAEFVVADITRPDWTDCLPGRAGGQPEPRTFDCVLMLAVLHHIPGNDVRARLMRQARELLAPRGRLVVSTWQFMDSERMRKKIVPWGTVGIDERELEPGDVLLDWKRGGAGLRYCHWIGKDELDALAAQASLNVVETWRAGGREGDLSLYAVLAAAS